MIGITGLFWDKAAARLKATRPTGTIWRRLLDRLMGMLAEDPNGPPPAEKILSCLQNVLERQRRISEDHGAPCRNASGFGGGDPDPLLRGGALLYMLQTAREKGKEIQVLCTETRPYCRARA